jgi:hypothetical protein
MDIDIGVRQGCILSGLLFIVFVDDLLEELNEKGGIRVKVDGEEIRVGGLMYADDLEVLEDDESRFEEMLGVVMKWKKRWRMTINIKKSEIVVFGEKDIVRKDGWIVEDAVIGEKDKAVCLGMLFNKSMKRDEYCKLRTGKVGGMIAFLPAIRRVLGEKAALSAWKVFMRSILVFGCEVMVWDRCGVRNIMDNINKKALRGVLGLDRGSSNNLVLGEAEDILISEEVKWMTARYGCTIGKMKDDNILKKILKFRDSNGAFLTWLPQRLHKRGVVQLFLARQ